MKRMLAASLAAAFAVACTAPGLAAPAAHAWKVIQRYPLGGSGGWDYLALDQAAQRLYVSRSNRVLVLDARNGKRIGEIDGLSGVHGIAIADDLHRGFISNGRGDTVTVFNLATLKVEQTVPVGAKDPDGIVYDPYSHRVFTFNGDSNDASVIDAVSGKLLGHIALPGRPEFPVSDGDGHVYDNIESRNALVEIDPMTMKVTATWPLKDCDSPSGLAIDTAHHRLFSVCQNKIMAVTNAENGKQVASVPIGEGPDAARFDPRRQRVFSSNGDSGTLTVVHETTPDSYHVLANVPTQKSARTMALDEASGRIFLSAAEFGPRPAPTQADPHPRHTVKPGSFTVLVAGPASN
ncbi:MAG: YncE family protein [Rhodanobacteraceae bacterium]|nr:MAG: YncE family protein [Rhodanobacteraceae bacterium]